MKREKKTQEKSSTSGKKIKLTKSNTNVEQQNLNLNLIFIICFYIRSFKRSIYLIRYFFANSLQLHNQREITPAK